MTQSAVVSINNRPVRVEWTRSAAQALAQRETPLTVELELYYSCLIKKFVHFHESPPDHVTVDASPKLRLFFRSVTSTACSMDKAAELGRQPETEITTEVVRKIAPREVHIDHVAGQWRGNYRL